MSQRCDLAVIGAGPAGLAAVATAAGLGLTTLLIDEQPQPGGQIYRATASSPLPDPGILGREYGRGQDLVAAFRSSGAGHLAGATVFDVTPERWLGIESGGRARYLEAGAVIVATGAMERPFPIPGWTLPGVMTAGAAQILLKSAAAMPGAATILAGTGPLLYLLAWQLTQAGRKIAAILDTTERAGYLRALPELPQALGAAAYLGKGLGLLRAIRKAGIRHVRGVTGLHAEGDGRLQAVSYRQGGAWFRLPTDLLLLHHGVVPNIQLPRAMRCEIAWDEVQLCWKPVLDAHGQTSQPGVFVAGDGAGIGGAVAAEHRGRVAALAAAALLRAIDETRRDQLAAEPRGHLAQEARIRPFLDQLYRPAPQFRVPEDDATIVCRCEEVTRGEIRQAVAMGCPGPNQLKAFLRAGMGPCQGRLCGLTVCETIAHDRARPVDEIGYYRLRMPIKPVELGMLAEMELPDGGPRQQGTAPTEALAAPA